MIDQTVWLAARATSFTVVCEECAAEHGYAGARVEGRLELPPEARASLLTEAPQLNGLPTQEYLKTRGGAHLSLHYGARLLSKRLAQHGIAHRYEEFDDNHSSIDYRMDTSLPFLYRALRP